MTETLTSGLARNLASPMPSPQSPQMRQASSIPRHFLPSNTILPLCSPHPGEVDFEASTVNAVDHGVEHDAPVMYNSTGVQNDSDLCTDSGCDCVDGPLGHQEDSEHDTGHDSGCLKEGCFGKDFCQNVI